MIEEVKRLRPVLPDRALARRVGERWTLLVVRELSYGPEALHRPRRRLPGIGTNILAARLKELEAAGIVEKKKLPPPAASTVYELTPRRAATCGRCCTSSPASGRPLAGPAAARRARAGLAHARARPRALAALPRAAGSRSGSATRRRRSSTAGDSRGSRRTTTSLVETRRDRVHHLVVDRRARRRARRGRRRPPLEQLLDRVRR